MLSVGLAQIVGSDEVILIDRLDFLEEPHSLDKFEPEDVTDGIGDEPVDEELV